MHFCKGILWLYAEVVGEENTSADPWAGPLMPAHVQFPKLWRDLNTDLGDLHIEELYGKSLELLSSLPWGEKSEPCSVLADLS